MIAPGVRSYEQRLVRDWLTTVASEGRARHFRLYGEPGSGKSELLRACKGFATEAGFVTLSVRCPGAEGGTLAHGILRESERFEAHLREAPDVLVVSRLLEGLALSRPLLLTIDDAGDMSAADAKDCRYLALYLAELPFCTIVAGRHAGPAHAVLPPSDGDIVLQALTPVEAGTLAGWIFAQAPAEVAADIVRRSAGSPREIAALATEARLRGTQTSRDVAAIAESRIQSRLLTLPPDQRRLLQYCALLGEPIDEAVLKSASAGGCGFFEALRRLEGPFLSRQGDRVRFASSEAREAAGKLPVDAELRSTLMDALISLDRVRVEDYECIARQALALGDTRAAWAALLRAAEALYASKDWERAARAFAGALAIRPPPLDRFVTFYRQYAACLRATNRLEQAEAIVGDALRIAARGSDGRASFDLAAVLCAIEMELQRFQVARATFERYVDDPGEEVDRAQLLAVGANIFADMMDLGRFEESAARLRKISAGVPALAIASLHYTEAQLQARAGEPAQALESWLKARLYANDAPSVFDESLSSTKSFIEMHHEGCKALERSPAGGPSTATHYLPQYLHFVADFAAGRWDEIDRRIERIALDELPASLQMELLVAPAAASALSGRVHPTMSRVRRLLAAAGPAEFGPYQFELAAWTVAHDASHADEELAARVVRCFQTQRFIDPMCFAPAAVALYASKFNRPLLSALAGHREGPASRWLRAQHEFSRGLAQSALTYPEAAQTLRTAALRCEELGATFFAALAARCAGSETKEQALALAALGVNDCVAAAAAAPAPPDVAGQPLTPREAQIARLVASGLKNREVAEHLFLSLRTVEVHLANTFEKLGIRSRTELTRLMLDARPPTGRRRARSERIS